MTGGIIIIIIIAPTLMKWCSGKSPIPSTARRLPYLPQPEDHCGVQVDNGKTRKTAQYQSLQQ